MAIRKCISNKLRFMVLERDKFKCKYCGVGSDFARLCLDHVNPVSNGGDNSFDNLVTACHECNMGKYDGVFFGIEDKRKKTLDRTFNEKMKYVNFRLPCGLVEEVERIAESRGWTYTMTHQQIMRQWVEKMQGVKNENTIRNG